MLVIAICQKFLSLWTNPKQWKSLEACNHQQSRPTNGVCTNLSLITTFNKVWQSGQNIFNRSTVHIGNILWPINILQRGRPPRREVHEHSLKLKRKKYYMYCNNGCIYKYQKQKTYQMHYRLHFFHLKLNSTRLDSSRLGSTQLDSTRLGWTPLHSTQLNLI